MTEEEWGKCTPSKKYPKKNRASAVYGVNAINGVLQKLLPLIFRQRDACYPGSQSYPPPVLCTHKLILPGMLCSTPAPHLPPPAARPCRLLLLPST
jgi:hypothetical protein